MRVVLIVKRMKPTVPNIKVRAQISIEFPEKTNFKLIRLLGFSTKWLGSLQAWSRDQLGKILKPKF